MYIQRTMVCENQRHGVIDMEHTSMNGTTRGCIPHTTVSNSYLHAVRRHTINRHSE